MILRHTLISVIFACWALAQNVNASTPSDAVAQYNQMHPDNKPLTDGYVNVGGVDYHYVAAGQGPLVILYHGFPSFWYAWKPQIAELSKHYRVVAVDGLGSNLSDKPADINRYRIDKLASDLNQLAYKVGGEQPFHLIGHDWGGALAWAFAQNYPDRVAKLVVLNAPPHNVFQELLRTNEQQQKTSRYIKVLNSSLGERILGFNDSYLIWKMAYQKHLDHERINTAEADLFRQALSRPQALHSAINWYRANTTDADSPLESALWPRENPLITVPSLLIWGEKDKAFVPEFLDMLPELVEHLTIKRLASAAHWPGLSHPQQVNQAINKFFSAPQGQDSPL
ncbi:MAG: alpha/beta fold hydrolase [Cellvibrionaceae bacterium]